MKRHIFRALTSTSNTALGRFQGGSKAPPLGTVRRPTVDIQRDRADERMGKGLLELAAVWGKK